MKKLMAANWKMYKLHKEAGETAEALVKAVKDLPADREVVIFPPFTSLRAVRKAIKKVEGFSLGGQNFFPSMQGAFTGEVAPEMLTDMGCVYALAGHSERRHIMGEADEFVGKKVAFGLERGLRMILCVGETIEERKEGRLEEVLRRQMQEGLAGVPADVAPERLSVAYEPVWAIGTGLTAGPKEILEAHALARTILREKFGAKADEMRLQYGGSVKPENASEILSLDNVDGVLVGGSSLSADSFSRIVLA